MEQASKLVCGTCGAPTVERLNVGWGKSGTKAVCSRDNTHDVRATPQPQDKQ